MKAPLIDTEQLPDDFTVSKTGASIMSTRVLEGSTQDRNDGKAMSLSLQR